MTDLDGEIQAAREQLGAVLEACAALRSQFITAAQAFVSTQIQSLAEEVVKGNPGRAKELGIEGLKSVKDDLAALEARMPQLVAERFGRAALWSDLLYDSHGLGELRHDAYADRTRFFDETKGLLGEVGVLMERHGFLTLDYDGPWQRAGSRGEARYTPSQFRLPEAMLTPLSAYAHRHAELMSAARELDSAIRKKEEAEAKSLWDQA